MSNDMQFSDPNASWNNSEQQNFYANSPYSEQERSSSQYASSSYLNNPYAKLNAFPPSRQRRRRWPWIILTVILLLVIGLGSGLYMVTTRLFSSIATQNTSSQAQVSDITTIPASAHPTIIVNSGSGFVHIHAGTDAHHIIAGIINPPFDTSSPSYTSSTGNQIITFDDTSSGDGLDLTVPTTTDLQIDSDGIEVVGVIGQMALTSPSGAITLLQSTVSGQSKLDNNGGPIFALEDSLSGQVTMSSNGGPITFGGVIAPNGKYTFSSNGSSIDITLPRTAIFHLDVSGIVEAFTTDFPGVSAPDATSGELHQNIGRSPNATLSLDINGGPIVLHKSS